MYIVLICCTVYSITGLRIVQVFPVKLCWQICSFCLTVTINKMESGSCCFLALTVKFIFNTGLMGLIHWLILHTWLFPAQGQRYQLVSMTYIKVILEPAHLGIDKDFLWLCCGERPETPEKTHLSDLGNIRLCPWIKHWDTDFYPQMFYTWVGSANKVWRE